MRLVRIVDGVWIHRGDGPALIMCLASGVSGSAGKPQSEPVPTTMVFLKRHISLLFEMIAQGGANAIDDRHTDQNANQEC